jgi:lauroyl/myristoyl acyltransferase
LSTAARVIPRRIAQPLCRLAGVAWFACAPRSRAAVRDNLRHILARRPSAAEVVAVLQNGALNYWDTFAIPHLTAEQIVRLVHLRGVEHIDAALAQGRGVIVASAHLGSVALVGQAIPALGYPMTGLLEPLEPPELYEFFARQRQAHGARLLPAGGPAVRELLKALRRNEVLGIVADRDVTGTGLLVPFFDAPARFPDGVAALAIRTGAPILVGVCARRADGDFDSLIEPLPEGPRTGDSREVVLRLTRALAERLQYHVASHPEQWTVFQRRWPHSQAG